MKTKWKKDIVEVERTGGGDFGTGGSPTGTKPTYTPSTSTATKPQYTPPTSTTEDKTPVQNLADLIGGDYKVNVDKAKDYLQKYENIGAFDIATDPNFGMLYNQYKNHYDKQAKLAMDDAIGRASAMTGGYGNSYAQTVGTQMYNARMDEMNNIIPELYNIAYGQYKDNKNDLLNKADIYSGLAQQEFDNYITRTEAEAPLEEEEEPTTPIKVDWGKIPQDVKDAVAKATTNAEINKIIERLLNAQIISEEEAIALAGYYGKEENFYKDGGNDQGGKTYYTGMMESPSAWKLAYDGGFNGLWGIDEDAEFVTPVGTTITAKDLYEYLIKEGMSKDVAKYKVIALQKALGAD